MQEVSRAHSINRQPSRRNHKLAEPIKKEQIQCEKLNPHYVCGFIDGEGSFSISFNRHKTMKLGVTVGPEFEIELRADDKEILKRIAKTLDCGIIYDCSYERYSWYPHTKYKITSRKELEEKLFPFLDKYHLQAKKKKVYRLFKQIVLLMKNKEHLSRKGMSKIAKLRDQMRRFGKKHRNIGNR